VNPLAPSFDSVGVLANNADVLANVALTLLTGPVFVKRPTTIHLIREAFALADGDVEQALSKPLSRLREMFGAAVRECSLQDIVPGEPGNGFSTWVETFGIIQWAEIESSLGAWIANAKPEFGPEIAASFLLMDQLDRRRVAKAMERREQYCRNLDEFLGPNDLLCIPTTPALAPRKGDPPMRSSSGSGYYPRTLSLTSIAGMGRLPQISIPMAEVEDVPVGLSLLGKRGHDAFLLGVAKSFSQEQVCS
jgi:amidase